MLSFGLVYLPGAYAATDELVAVAEEAAAFGVPLVPHVRNEGNGLLEAVAEMIDVARRSGAPLHISHLKSLADESLIEPLLELLERPPTSSMSSTSTPTARAAPCSRASSRLGAGGRRGRTLARFGPRRPTPHRARDRQRAAGLGEHPRHPRAEQIEIANAAAPNEDAVGRTLAEIGADRARRGRRRALDLMSESALDVTMVLHYAAEAAVRAIARHPLQLVGSDGIFGGRPHPRLYATTALPRRLSLRDGLLPVEEAVARLTSRAADRLGLSDRGRIAVGKRADLVLLDPARYIDTATYADPARHPRASPASGSRWARLEDGVPTGARPGGVVPPWRRGRAAAARPAGSSR